MKILEELDQRGLVQDISDPAALAKLPEGATFYHGIDPSAESLQVGNFVGIMVVARLAQAGLKPILLFGGATGSIGDPSGKSAERNLLSLDKIRENIQRQSEQITRLFSRLDCKPEFVNNYDWTKDMSMLDFMRDVGKHFPVNYMIAKETVKTRLEGDGISYTEFSYMLLQAFDFYHLSQTRDCKLQIGGSDQWGNITAGLELIRRKGGGEAFGFSWPLITDSQGRKFGKSAGQAIWLDPEMTSPYEFHQYWLNIEDAEVGKLLRTFSLRSLDEISALEAEAQASPEKRLAQAALADELCMLVHGDEALALAKKSASVLFGGSLEGLKRDDLESIFKDVPSSDLSFSDFGDGNALDLFAQSSLVSSKGEAKRLLQSGGLYVNNQRLEKAEMNLKKESQVFDGLLILRSGKKKYHLIKVHD